MFWPTETREKEPFLRHLFDGARSGGSEQKISASAANRNYDMRLTELLNAFIATLLFIMPLYSELLHIRKVFSLATRQPNKQSSTKPGNSLEWSDAG